jgi:hypothetical protein
VSYKSLLMHRVDVQRASTTEVDGMQSYEWTTVGSSIRCRLDLNYIRPGVDPQWTPEAGRATDRTGVAFFMAGANVRPGDRLVCRRGPQGTFLCEGANAEALDSKGLTHHIEVGVREVPGPRARAS